MIMIGSTPEFVRAINLSDNRRAVLLSELIPPTVLLTLTASIVFLCHRARKTRPAVILAIAAADLAAVAWLRPVDFARRGDLVAESPVLGYLKSDLPGQRGMDGMQNLAMIAGAAPVRSYRTVDIPFLETINPIIFDPRFYLAEQRERMMGRSDLRWFLQAGSSEGWRLRHPSDDIYVDFADPVLGRIVHGPELCRTFPNSTAQFYVRQPEVADRGRAWFVAEGRNAPETLLVTKFGGYGRRPHMEDRFFGVPASPVSLIRSDPEFAEFEFRTTAPGIVLFSELAYPGWEAKLISDGGERAADVLPTLPGCRAVRIPSSGEFRLTLRFRSPMFEKGRQISVVAWAVLAIALMATILNRAWLTRGAETV
jgi:hypothetical protein